VTKRNTSCHVDQIADAVLERPAGTQMNHLIHPAPLCAFPAATGQAPWRRVYLVVRRNAGESDCSIQAA
jgi:hypothetical protein